MFGVVSVLTILVSLTIVALLWRAEMRRHATVLSSHSHAIDQLTVDLESAREELHGLQRRLAESRAEEPRRIPQRTSERPPAPEPAASADAPEPTTTAPNPPADPIAQLRNLLAECSRRDDAGRLEIIDAAAADEAITIVRTSDGPMNLDADAWATLALLAGMRGAFEIADGFALHAERAGEPAAAYYDFRTRAALDVDAATEAYVFARKLLRIRPDDPEARVLFADACRLRSDWLNADLAVRKIDGAASLSIAARLRLADVLVALERWAVLDELVAGIQDVPETDRRRLNRLRGIAAIYGGRLSEALAIFDSLLASDPTDYDLTVWRGVALFRAGQWEAARETLTRAADDASRPEASYWLGRLEDQNGDVAGARESFRRALAASQRFAPAWDALAKLAINDNDMQSARQHLASALNANPRRASTHFLLALVHAKLGAEDETARGVGDGVRTGPFAGRGRETDRRDRAALPRRCARAVGKHAGRRRTGANRRPAGRGHGRHSGTGNRGTVSRATGLLSGLALALLAGCASQKPHELLTRRSQPLEAPSLARFATELQKSGSGPIWRDTLLLADEFSADLLVLRGDLSRRLHQWHDLTLIVHRGHGTVAIWANGRRRQHVVQPGDVFHIPRNTPYACRTDGRDPLVLLLLYTPPLTSDETTPVPRGARSYERTAPAPVDDD